ncbi:MAG TPA: TIGR03435 family protein [Verrucomicrobiae bacterium]|jgi:uncharacterized protein (TIGR03435 family)
MPDPNDMDLVREFARDNSETAFTELVRRHLNLVYSVARRCTGNDGDAHDVAQAVFIILARKAAGLREKTLLTGWLYETTRFTASRLLRTNARRHAREQEAFMQSTLNEADTAGVWEKLSPHLETAMGKLNAADRALLVLRFYENKSGPEAAALLGINENTLHKRVTRAIEKLRKFFMKRGVTLSGTAIAGAVSANSVQAAPLVLAKSVTAVAIVKGSIATASTLTLVKGALNLMAWAKAKTTIIGASVLLAATTATTVAINWELNSEALDKNPPTIILRPTQFQHMTGGATSGQKIVLKNVSLRLLLSMAYAPLDFYAHLEYRMVLPSNCPKGNFDFIFTLFGDHTTALKNEIKKQFDLVAHLETRQTDVLLAKVTNSNAPGLKIVSTNENQQIGNFRNVVFKGVTIDWLTGWLEAITKTPVINQTGLTNYYDITVKWKPQAGQSEADAIRQILPEQFGLELVPTNMPLEMLVVEKAE